jgi:hypothetical protein
LEYWIDDDWYIGRLKEVLGSLEDLEENIRDAYRLMGVEESSHRTMTQTKEIGIEFAR